jgi:hypothetical protein
MMMDIAKFCRERAATYGALRKASLTANALDLAADELDAQAKRIDELESDLTDTRRDLERLQEAVLFEAQCKK